MGLVGIAITLVLVGAVWYWLATRRTRARRRMDRTPFPESWRAVLEREVGYYGRISAEELARFEREVRYFVHEHTITGPRGARVSDETKVLVAASAVILAFGRPGFRYRSWRDIVVYADAFDEDYSVSPRGSIVGQVHRQGPILLSEKDLHRSFANEEDGHHVGLHEFAHVLDMGTGRPDGVPTLMPWKAIRPWLGLMYREVERVRRRRSVLRRYAAKNEAEFFAVATEAFFERPQALRKRHPELYAMLVETYGQDPASGS